MTDEKATTRYRWRNHVVSAVVILVLYPLSLGPAAWLDEHGLLGPFRQVAEIIYWPLIQGLDHYDGTAIARLFMEYVFFWQAL